MSLYQKVVAWCAAARQPNDAALQHPGEPLTPASVDRVADWLARQDETWAAPLPVSQSAQVEEFFVEDDIQLPMSAAKHFDVTSDRALSSVEDLYEAFKRLEQELETISDSLQTYNQRP